MPLKGPLPYSLPFGYGAYFQPFIKMYGTFPGIFEESEPTTLQVEFTEVITDYLVINQEDEYDSVKE